MKIALIYFLLVVTLLPSISPWGTIAYYQINKDYIAKVLCENRNRPELRCNGKCYLAKRLKAQQDKQDKETTERLQNLPAFQLFCDSGSPFSLAPVTKLVVPYSSFSYLLAAITRPLCKLP